VNGETPDSRVVDRADRTIRVAVVRLPEHEDLPYPTYQTPGSAGADLHAAIREPLTVRGGEIHLIPTGVAFAIPELWEGQIRARSGWAVKHGLALVNAPGTIDSDYRGEIKVVVTCLKNEPMTIKRGDRIAQIVFTPVGRAIFDHVASLDGSVRGAGGFGHTGTSTENPDC